MILQRESVMKSFLKLALATCVASVTAHAISQVTFFEHDGYAGRTFDTDRPVENFEHYGYNDRASSVVVTRGRWEVCEDMQFTGRCVVLRRGSYPSLSAMGLNDRVSSVRDVRRDSRVENDRMAPEPLAAQVTFYEREGFQGRSFTTERPVANFERFGFNDRASSVVVVGQRWEVCEEARFGGQCVVLRPGRYPSLEAMRLGDQVSSVRTVGATSRFDDDRYAPVPQPVYDARRRGNERLYQADITSVRAVLGTPEQRCWVEQERISQERGGANVGAAIAGAILGGILGHQVGGGRGQDVATAGGAVAGAAVGANIGRGGAGPTQNVQRCSTAPGQGRPDYWDVTYSFRGVEHRIQMTTAPGATITVNDQGEPRA